jgi:hypothetical protein
VQGQDPAVIEASSSRLSGTVADLLVRGKARVDLKDVTFSNALQPIVAWRSTELVLRSCRFTDDAGLKLFVYANSRVRFVDMPHPPKVVSTRDTVAARADAAESLGIAFADEGAAPAPPQKPMNIIRLNNPVAKWKKDIFNKKTP